MDEAVTVNITGKVQGVFFRAETRKAAMALNVTGHVRNMPDGSVKALIQGKQKDVLAMINWCKKGSPLSRVDGVTVEKTAVKDRGTGFEIRY